MRPAGSVRAFLIGGRVISLVDLDRYDSEHSLFAFAQLAWPYVESSRFQPNWHHKVICEHLEAVSSLQIRNLVINQPPGTSKSLFVNVFWPVWEWLKRPETRWLYFSFDQNLVGQRDGGKCIALLQSAWFTQRWGNILTSKNPSARNFDNSAGGFRYASSPGAGGTGRHGNKVVIDDPIKPPDPKQKASVTRAQLDKVDGWWSARASSRQADPTTHCQILVMQRVHNADLASRFIAEGWTHLNLPMRYEPSAAYSYDRRTFEGELLHPERFPEQSVKVIETAMGPTVAAAQLQQRPNVAGGKTFKRVYWRFWHHIEGVPEPCLCEDCWRAEAPNPLHRMDRQCRVLPPSGFDFTSWDCAFKDTDDSDFVAGGAWRIAQDYYLMRIRNERLNYPATKIAILSMAAQFPSAVNHLIEDKANGSAVLAELAHDVSGLIGIDPEGGKEARANATEGPLAALRVFVPHPDLDPSTWPLLHQAERFPNDVNDDMVDMFTQAIVWAREQGHDMFDRAMAAIMRRSA